ncbi:MAG: putative manganese-dependent inorganic diphosphatase [Oscillospiraceae bacterium]|nr:putative manganese-dependent inorganic diphosphatase [Oscillospiraceae bacterium]
MEQVFVTGHRNPDTDSIVSAMSYAALQNALGERGCTAARLGHLNDESKRILERFGFEPPVYIKDMRTQVLDLDYDTPPALSAALTVARGWDILRNDANIAAIPVTNEDGTLFGMLSSGDVADYDMQTIEDPMVRDVPLFNLLSVLEGRVLNDAGACVDSISGEVVLGLPKGSEQLLFDHDNYVAVCGDQPEVIRWALETNIHALILCEAELSPELRALETRTCIISTPFSAYRAARLIFQSIPIARICQTRELVTFRLTDYLDDVREAVSKSRYRCYPILDADGRVMGTLSRYHLIKPRRKKVVLVDHNEAAQSVPGLDQVELLGIIDHHRLADIQSTNPIFFRNEIVGSTTTIVAEMYQEKGLMPSKKMAGLMCAAILSDTVIFKSPTSTPRDRTIAERLARIGGVDLEELGKFIFAASLGGNKSAKDLMYTDFKDFHIAGHYLGVSQITCVDSVSMLARKEEFLAEMEQARAEKGYSIMILMLTDVLLEGTQIIFLGDPDDIAQAFNVEPKGNTLFLPGVMSRKKQVIPMLSALWG